MNKNTHLLKCSIDELMRDISITKDPIRRTILKNFINIKLKELQEKEEDISLDNCSKESKESKEKKKRKKDYSEEDELMDILKKQKEKISEIDDVQKMKAYAEILEDNIKDKDNKEVELTRGKTESKWGSTYDPKYIKYVKEDLLNNKLMERLNSEIDFRHDDVNVIQIEKPFEDEDINSQNGDEPFAKYEKPSIAIKNKKRMPKKHMPNKRKSYY